MRELKSPTASGGDARSTRNACGATRTRRFVPHDGAEELGPAAADKREMVEELAADIAKVGGALGLIGMRAFAFSPPWS